MKGIAVIALKNDVRMGGIYQATSYSDTQDY